MIDCLFCAIVRGDESASRVYETESVLAFMNIRQGNPGHVLVVPKAHVGTLDMLDMAMTAALFQAVVTVARAVRQTFNADGINIWQSNGAAAGQEIPHVHVHVVPRKTGDDLIRFYRQTPPPASRATLNSLAERLRATLQTS